MAADAGGSAPRTSRAGIFGWMLFDWAAQPFFTVVTTFIFGPYLVSRMAPDPATGQAAWGFGVAAAGLVIAVFSPVLGAVADRAGGRKPWIAAFAAVKAASLCALWWAAPGGSLFWAVFAFSCASVAAEFSVVFNDSMIPRLLAPASIGRISNIAWGIGYLGGMAVLIFVVLFLAASPETGLTLLGRPPLFGLDPRLGEDARASAPIAAAWYLVFILPMFLLTPDQGRGLPLRRAVGAGLADLGATLKEARARPGLFRFLVGRMIVQDGVGALLALGGTFAAAMFSWSLTEVGLFGIILNVVAVFGCLGAAKVDTALGSKAVVTASLLALVAATVGIVSTGPGFTLFGLLPLPGADTGGLFGSPAEKAYLGFGLLIGLAFGPVQASARSWLARSVRPEEAGRYFGLYALSGRATSFLAPFAVATVTALSASPRWGMATITVFLLVGLGVLLRTPYSGGGKRAVGQ